MSEKAGSVFVTYKEGGRKGWPIILSRLKSLLETGRALPAFDPSK